MDYRGMERYKRQAGAKAIEYAIVFPVFFALFYAILMYGFIFLARMSLQHAAEDGARAALNFPGSILEATTELAVRQANAMAVAAEQAEWMGAPTVDVSICAIGTSCSDNSIDEDCTRTAAYITRCQILVTLTYSYSDNPIIPPLPGFGLLAPESLQGSARVLLDGRALSPP